MNEWPGYFGKKGGTAYFTSLAIIIRLQGAFFCVGLRKVLMANVGCSPRGEYEAKSGLLLD
ncbi:MAG: hypothetical protein LIO37_04815 [Clostridiales bacterium]|nr:hypothetical protein [Clostridiales bacterium]